MKDILEEIVAWKRVEVEQMKAALPMRELELQVEWMHSTQKDIPSMSRALRQSDTGIIAEMKRRSPSKGWINEQARAGEVPLGYERHGAAAVSILTDDRFFGGSDAFVCEARQSGLSLPVLYKNFVVDAYQVLQARCCGASAVLLIVSILSIEQIKKYIEICDTLGLSALVECHDEKEIDAAIECGARIIGVNNRNLKDFSVDIELAKALRNRVPEGIVFVSESGVKDENDIKRVKEMGADAVLIGEALMRAENKAEMLKTFSEVQLEIKK